jgi:hypothetical protein
VQTPVFPVPGLASPGASASLSLTSATHRIPWRRVTFVPFRPGFPRAERKLRDQLPVAQIDVLDFLVNRPAASHPPSMKE